MTQPQVLYRIKTLLKIGKIRGPIETKEGKKYYTYIVGDMKGTSKIIDVFNGKLVLDNNKKIFEKYVTLYNKRCTTDTVEHRITAPGDMLSQHVLGLDKKNFIDNKIYPSFNDG